MKTFLILQRFEDSVREVQRGIEQVMNEKGKKNQRHKKLTQGECLHMTVPEKQLVSWPFPGGLIASPHFPEISRF
ncbi:MAG: hypothetical protein SFW36_14495 [Leptolyngbyaceae cyanobacterium bins.59]|nr:hypothetical protein [Leptolyngbyaceae cyanobacterium bins.59]